VFQNQAKKAKHKNDYALEVAIARARWHKEKQEHDINRAKNAMPSNWGRQPIGTNTTQNYMRVAGIPNIVGTCVADLVDGAILVGEGKLQDKKMGDFVPPPSHDAMHNMGGGDSLAQQQMRMETEMRRQLGDFQLNFQNSEEERKRAWKKMLKTKAELDLPQAGLFPQNQRRGRMQLDLTNYHLVPMPALRASGQQTMPQEFSMARADVASYAPPVTAHGDPTGGSDSKYSAARVRERISADGSVAPVSEPKKTKDGLYQRPAGRTRKGMQWDALRGIWLPDGSN
jgi:hypothetical protein